MAGKAVNMNEIYKINGSAKIKASAENPPLLIHLTVMILLSNPYFDKFRTTSVLGLPVCLSLNFYKVIPTGMFYHFSLCFC